MENHRMSWRRASFTVEATFIMVFVTWVILGICYLSLFIHDRTVLPSTGINYLAMCVEQEQMPGEAQMETGLMECLQDQMLLCKIQSVSVKKRALALEVRVRFKAQVSMPFVKEFLTGRDRELDTFSYPLSRPCNLMWDSELWKGDEGK